MIVIEVCDVIEYLFICCNINRTKVEYEPQLSVKFRQALKTTTIIQPVFINYKNCSCLIRRPISATSHRPLRSLDRLDLLVPRARTTMAKSRAFAFIGPSLWNQLPSSTRSLILSGGPGAPFRCLKTTLFARSLSHWERL